MPSMPRPDAVTVPDSVQAFLTGTALVAAFTTMRPDGTPHVAPVRFTWDADAQLARVMTVRSSRKARNLLATPGAPVALCQVDGFRWVTLEGTGTVVTDPNGWRSGHGCTPSGTGPPADPVRPGGHRDRGRPRPQPERLNA